LAEKKSEKTAEELFKLARAKYAAKVCGYLGLPPEKCYDEFEKLYKNMRFVVGLI